MSPVSFVSSLSTFSIISTCGPLTAEPLMFVTVPKTLNVFPLSATGSFPVMLVKVASLVMLTSPSSKCLGVASNIVQPRLPRFAST